MPQVTDQLALTLLLVCRAAGLAICPQVHARQHATSGACQRHGHTRSAPEGACWPIGRAGEDLGHLAAALHPIDELLYAMAASRLAVQHKTYQQTVRDARLPLVMHHLFSLIVVLPTNLLLSTDEEREEGRENG